MKISFGVCNKCKSFNYKELVKELLARWPDAKFDVKCQSYCGPGSKQPFVSVNENFIEANDIASLVSKVEVLLEEKNAK